MGVFKVMFFFIIFYLKIKNVIICLLLVVLISSYFVLFKNKFSVIRMELNCLFIFLRLDMKFL